MSCLYFAFLSPIVSKWGGRNGSSIDSKGCSCSKRSWLANNNNNMEWAVPQNINTEHLPHFTVKNGDKDSEDLYCHCTVLQCLRATGKLCLICVVLTMNLVEVFCSDYSLGCDRISRSRGIFFVLIPWTLFTSIRLAHLSGFSQNFSFFLKKFWTFSPIYFGSAYLLDSQLCPRSVFFFPSALIHSLRCSAVVPLQIPVRGVSQEKTELKRTAISLPWSDHEHHLECHLDWWPDLYFNSCVPECSRRQSWRKLHCGGGFHSW